MKRLNALLKCLCLTAVPLVFAMAGNATTYYLWQGTNNNPADASYVSSATESGSETSWTVSGLTINSNYWFGVGTNSTSYTSMLNMMTGSSTVTGTACGSGSHLQHYGISGTDYFWANLVPTVSNVKIIYNSSTKNIVINLDYGITATPSTFEYGDDVTLTFEGGTAPYSWEYSTDGGTTYTALSATGDAITVKAGIAKIYRCTDANSKSATFKVAPEMDLDCDETNARTLFEDDFGTLSVNLNPTGSDRGLYCMIPSGWSEIYCYAYGASSGTEYLGTWPGTKMSTETCGYNYVSLPASAADDVKFIFNCGSNACQSGDLSVDFSQTLSESNTNVYRPDFSAENPTIIARKMRAENSYTKYTFIDGCGKIANGGEYAVVAEPQWCGCNKSTGEHYGDHCKCGYYDAVNFWFRTDMFFDHTHHTAGYPDGTLGGMLMLNCADGSSTDDDILYERTATNLCANTYTRFSMWVANAAKADCTDPIKLRFKLLTESGTLIESKDLDGLNFDAGWQQVKIMFNTGSNTSVKVQVINKAGYGSAGNDVLLDDLKFQACTPESFLYSNAETMQQDTVLLCPYDNKSQVEYITLTSVVNSTITDPYYYWQLSEDGTTWAATSIKQGFGSSNSTNVVTSGQCGYYRVIIAKSAEDAQKVADGTISGACGLYSITNTVHVECRDIEVYVSAGTFCTSTDKVKYVVKVVNKLPYNISNVKLEALIGSEVTFDKSINIPHIENKTSGLSAISTNWKGAGTPGDNWEITYSELPAYQEGASEQDTLIFEYYATPTTTADALNSKFYISEAKGLQNQSYEFAPANSRALNTSKVLSTCDDVSLSLSVTPSSVCLGEEFTYTITLTNNRETAAAAVDVKVTIPSTQTYVSCTGGTYDTTTGLISVASFAASEVKTITFKTTGASAGSGDFSAQVSNAASTLQSVSVTVNALPTATISGANVINCTNPSITLTAGTDASSASYTWSNGGNDKTTSVSDAGDYYVTVTNTATGCSTKSAAHSVTKNVTEPTATVSGGTKIDCTIESVKLTASTNATNVSYLWSTGATDKEITLTDGGTYYVTVTNTDNGCSKQSSDFTVTKDVTKPTASISGDDAVCQGGTLTLTGSGGDSYKWNDGEYGTAATYSVPTGTSGAQTIKLRVKSASNGCESDEASKSVTVNAKPSISVTTPAACSPDLTTYSVGVTVSEGTVTCDKSATITNIGNVWTISGVTAGQNCTITVTTTAGCTNSVSITAPDCQCPVIGAPTNPQDNSYCAGSAKTSISVDAPASGYEIHWYDAATGGTEVATGASFTPSAAGTYYAEMVQTVSGCKSSSRTSATLTENPLPTATISGANVINCTNPSITLTAGTDASSASYTWSNGGNDKTTSVSDAGDYYVTVTNTATGCSTKSAAHSVTKNVTEPTATVSGGTKIDCTIESVKLTASTNATNVSYLWSTGATDKEITLTDGGTYYVTVTNTDNGCSKQSSDFTVTKDVTKPTATISGANVINCTNPSITLTAGTDASSASYTWSNGGNDKTTSVSDAGDYYVTVTNTATGCSTKSAAHSVTKNVTEPTATVSGGTKIDCTIESVKLTANTNATNVSYLWSTGATDKEITLTDGGTYYVTVTNTDNGCSKQSSDFTVTKDVTKPTATISGANIVNCTNPSITLTAGTDASSASYTWSNGGNDKTTSVSDAGDYYVTVTNTANGCSAKSAAHSVTKNVTEPTATVSGGTKIDCTIESVKLTASTNATNVSYLWSTGATDKEITLTDGGTYYVTVTNTANGCSKQSSDFTVTKDVTKPTASISGDGDVCQGGTLTLTGSGGDSYSWNGGAYTTTSTYDVNTTSAGAQNITLKVKSSSNGCESSEVSKSVTVNPLPTLTYKVMNPATESEMAEPYVLTCYVPSARVDLNGGATYKWNDGSTDASRTIGEEGAYSVYAISDKGCEGAPESIEFTVDKYKPVLQISSKDATGKDNTLLTCSVTEITLNAELTNPDKVSDVTYKWSTSEATQEIKVTSPATYKVTATAGSNGCESDENAITITQDVNVPVVKIEAPTDTLTCAASTQSVTLYAKASIANCTFKWNTGEEGANLTVDEEGDYSVIATSTNGCQSAAADTSVVDKRQIPVITIMKSAEKVTCNPDTLTATSDSKGMSYNWITDGYAQPSIDGQAYFGDDDVDPNAILVINDAGTYKVEGTNRYSCKGTAEITVEEDKTAPVITIDAATDVITCSAPKLEVEAKETSGLEKVTYKWSNGKTTAANKFTEKGTYTVTATNVATACTSEAKITVKENKQYPIVALQALDPVCLPATVDISKAIIPASSKYDEVKYYTDAAGTEELESPIVEVETKKVFYVQGFGVNGSGCVGQRIAPIEVVLKDVTATPTVEAYNECPVAEARSLKNQVTSDRTELKFYMSESSATPVSDMFDASKENSSATYYVTNTEFGKCESEREAIEVIIDGTVDINLSASDDKVMAAQKEVTVTAESIKESSVNRYEWRKNAVTLPETGDEVSGLLYSTTKFTVTAYGRCNSVTKDITVEALWPTLITPKTGANAYFARGCQIVIYNRFNEKVFQGSDGWDGTIDCNLAKKGEVASPGVYYYYINIPDGSVHKGTIEVVKF